MKKIVGFLPSSKRLHFENENFFENFENFFISEFGRLLITEPKAFQRLPIVFHRFLYSKCLVPFQIEEVAWTWHYQRIFQSFMKNVEEVGE